MGSEAGHWLIGMILIVAFSPFRAEQPNLAFQARKRNDHAHSDRFQSPLGVWYLLEPLMRGSGSFQDTDLTT